MNTFSFLNSPLLWGTTLAAIPIIIHLLYRRKYMQVDWAPMRYLKLSIQRHRRRVRLEQLLLLLTRMGAVLLLFFLLARPIMHAEGLGAWLSGKGRTSQILLIDDSLSMGFRERGQSALERAQQLAADIIETVDPKDHFTLVVSSQPQTPILREVEVGDRDEVVRLIRGLTPSSTFTSWEPTIQALDQLISSGTYPISDVTIITDMRRAGWDARLSEVASRWVTGRVRLRLFDVGSEQTRNATLIGFEQTDRLALVGTPTRWEAVIRNNTDAEMKDVEADFIVDGKPSLVRLPAIPAGGTVRLPLLATFQEPGIHYVSFKLPGDDLLGDDQRWATLNVQEYLFMLLVDGEPSRDPLGGEVDFLALALSLGVGQADAFRVHVVTDSEWVSMPDVQPDLLVLANVSHISSEQAGLLERMVDSGTGLMIFAGDQIDPDNYNEVLYQGGSGLLPAQLESIIDGEVSGLIVENESSSPLDALLQLKPSVLEAIRIGSFQQLRMPTEMPQGVRVVAHWNDPGGSPAVVEKVVGKGRVLLWTVTADKKWSSWPTEPSYVLAMRESAKAIARTELSHQALTAGQAVRRSVAVDHEIIAPMVEVPDVDEPQPLQIEVSEQGGDGQRDPSRSLVCTDTGRAGLYRMTWQDSVSGPGHDLFAVNPDVRESDLQRIPVDQLRNLWSPLEPEVISAVDGGDTPVAIRGREIWRTLATALFCLLAFEACFATWTGRQR